MIILIVSVVFFVVLISFILRDLCKQVDKERNHE